MRNLHHLIIIVLVALAATSCRTRSQMLYLEDMQPGVSYPVTGRKDLTIKPDDKLSIKVSCKSPELALVFNMPGSGGYTVNTDGTISSTSSDIDKGYTVADDGTIDFPVIGKLSVSGLTCRQLSEKIRGELISRNLITDPYVSSEIINFTFSVLGEAGKVGTFEVKGKDRITIIDALAQAGDLTDDSKLDRIAVIREVDGKRQIYYNNIRSKSIFDSPTYYLQQNDIIYVEPNENKSREESRRSLQWIFTGTSLLATVISLITVITK